MYKRRSSQNKSIQFIKKPTRKGMNDLHQKIDKYVYEIRMIELDEYLHGMNRKKIDKV